MSTAKWWVLDARGNGFAVEQRPSGDVVVSNSTTSEEHVLHGYVWKHSPSFGIQIQSEGPPPYGHWVENPED
ncbi:MAG: maltose regulon activator MalT [Rhodococcus sp.]|uniref:maltose regulon activator MalT n=1 Tax=Rhodococcus sp. TaxID=1831 RepID=UPI001696EAC3|nr:maltose regulon activator MalT [Rhodococcus sp. (in: high G+C Gram-positive bacteria)]NLV78500.1 maltose regulon activator MalT [Rhodococcus sp. (in: high G+C Gram-positive bacteria)]